MDTIQPGTEALLCVANFPANTGFAWDFIEGLYAGVADRLAPLGVSTWVAYPSIGEAPRTLAGSAARAVELPWELGSRGELLALLRFVREHRVRTVYLTDRPAWHPAYALLRAAGVRRIVVHDHTSGARTAPRGARRFAKRLTRRVPGMMADLVIGVSDYVARRAVEVSLVPPGRVGRIWNAVELPPLDGGAGARMRGALGLEAERPVVMCVCRAAPEKGVAHLLRAFDRVWRDGGRPLLVYVGDGPEMEALGRLRDGLASREDIVFAGYRQDARELLAGADLCVVPSLWQEACPLGVLEPMAAGVPVVASRVGGIPELCPHGETGALVAPGDEAGLAEAIGALLADGARRERLGRNARLRVVAHFSGDGQLREIAAALRGPRSPRGAPRGAGAPEVAA